MCKYINKVNGFMSLLRGYCETIFSCYNKELLLRLEEYNLLSRKDNCIESSTAIGYIIEEFVVSKLEIYTNVKSGIEFKVHPSGANAAELSYDCFADYENIHFLINIKVCLHNNDAVAAIGRLADDYLKDINKEQSFIVLKIHYDFDKSDANRVITINELETYNLEEVDFSKEHRQDHRNWNAKEMNYNSGRLVVSKTFRNTHKNSEISYENTCNQINMILERNSHK